MTDPDFSVVVPVYGNEETLPELMRRLVGLAQGLSGSLEAVFVVDGSPDDSAGVLRRALPAGGLYGIQIVEHSRNFGAFSAIRTGLSVARGRWIAVVAADLQEPIHLVKEFLCQLSSGDADVAVGVRASRNDPIASSLLSRLYWGLYRRVIVRDIPAGGVDVFACTARVKNQLVALRESHTSLVAQLYWLGYRRSEIPYVRQSRVHGHSGWSLRKRFTYMQDSVYAFTAIPITVITIIGIAGVVLSLLASLVVAVSWFSGAIEVPGYTPLMLALLLMTSGLMAGIGIVGSYVWRTYENSKARPLSVVASHEIHDAQ